MSCCVTNIIYVVNNAFSSSNLSIRLYLLFSQRRICRHRLF
nr:MAG TPA: hypothetical protein [Caudoviricetes sp.]